MKNFFKKLKNKYVIIALVAVVLIAAGFVLFRKNGNGVERVVAEKKDVTQAVLAAGKTKAVDTVDLGFEKSGKIAVAYVDVGDRVRAGDTLLTLDSSELQADLLKARADLAEENASNVTSGIAVSDAVINAKNVISDAYTQADNVVRGKLDQFFDNPGEVSLNFNPRIQNGSNDTIFTVEVNDRIDINDKRREVGVEMNTWKMQLAVLANTDISSSLSQSEVYVRSVLELVDRIASVIFTLTAYQNADVAAVAGFKTDVSGARTTMNTTLSAVNTAREKLNNARASETPAMSDGGVITAQEARVLQLQAQIQNIESQIAKTQIQAPFDGIVTKQDAERGEIVTAGNTIVSVISDQKLEIESNVSEVNIGKITVGNPVSITFDAYPGEVFSGTVSYIDPGETVIDNVVNYKVKVTLGGDLAKLKSGLTANLTIETSKKVQVLTVPLFAVTSKPDGAYVKKVSGEEVIEVPVTLGIVGQDGSVEILAGLSEGDVIETGSK